MNIYLVFVFFLLRVIYNRNRECPKALLLLDIRRARVPRRYRARKGLRLIKRRLPRRAKTAAAAVRRRRRRRSRVFKRLIRRVYII